MSEFPDTRDSLLLRVRQDDDPEAWHEFVAVYRPVVYRLARQRGLQDADAQDLAQRVLMSVARAIDRWEPDSQRGKFRTWLRTIARNAVLNALSRARPDRPPGGSDAFHLLQQQPQATAQDEEQLRWEHRRQVFRFAARQARGEFSESTWLAFWETTVEGQPIEETVRQLDKSPGAVYAARSRVMRRIKEIVHDQCQDL